VTVAGVAPLVVGALAVAQAGLNRQVAARHGLVVATCLNAAVFVACGAVLLGVARWRPAWLPRGFGLQAATAPPALWYVVPGLCGFALVMTMPWAVGKLGAQRAFITLVVGQVVASIAWDLAVEGLAPRPLRLVGVAIALAGVAVANAAR
jgi:uncharacterized membrane protein YdcZ (DUF606 family)